MAKTIADALRDGLQDIITQNWNTKELSQSTARQFREIIQAHALCRIADALEKLVPPQFEAPVPIPGTQSPNPDPAWTRCPKCKDHPGYIGEAYCDCPIGRDLKRIQTPKAGA